MKIPGKMILIAVLVPVLLSLPFFGYMWSLFMHIFGAILLMGNVIVSAVWASLAKRDHRPDTVRFASRAIALTDVIFTTPGVVLVLLNGGILGTPYFKAGGSWLFVSIGLFFVAAIMWLAGLVPLQRRMLAIAEGMAGADPVPDVWFDAARKWFRLGGIATMFMLLTLVLMVSKPTFW